jgi:hypothetical protein
MARASLPSVFMIMSAPGVVDDPPCKTRTRLLSGNHDTPRPPGNECLVDPSGVIINPVKVPGTVPALTANNSLPSGDTSGAAACGGDGCNVALQTDAALPSRLRNRSAIKSSTAPIALRGRDRRRRNAGVALRDSRGCIDQRGWGRKQPIGDSRPGRHEQTTPPSMTRRFECMNRLRLLACVIVTVACGGADQSVRPLPLLPRSPFPLKSATLSGSGYQPREPRRSRRGSRRIERRLSRRVAE